MSVENVKINDTYFHLSDLLMDRITSLFPSFTKDLFVIGIGGESGSGKTVTATCLKETLLNAGINTQVLHMDGYFHLPPADNHQQRLGGFEHVGPHEVKLALLDEHIRAFRKQEQVDVPITDFQNNRFLTNSVDFRRVNVLLIEGTYVLDLKELDCSIFIERTYHQTLTDRISRGRERFDPFVEKVLEIEHNIIKKYADLANIIVREDFNLN